MPLALGQRNRADVLANSDQDDVFGVQTGLSRSESGDKHR